MMDILTDYRLYVIANTFIQATWFYIWLKDRREH